MHAVALSTGKYPYFFLLIRTCKVELRHVGSRIDFLVAKLHQLIAIRDQLVDGLVRIECIMLLVDIGQLDGFTHLKVARIRFFLASNQFEEGRLSSSIGANDPHDASLRQGEV